GSGPSVRWLNVVGESYYAGTSTGLYRADATLDGPITWVPQSPDVIGNTVIYQMQTRISDSTLYVGTHGNGVYSAQVDVPCKASPSIGSSNIRVEQVSLNQISIALDAGDGDHRLVLAKAGSDFVNADLPVNGQAYEANANFGLGDQIGDAFVLFITNRDTLVTLDIPSNTEYFITVVEFNCGQSPQYLNNDRDLAQISLSCDGPTQNASDLSFSTITEDLLELSWTAGDGLGRLILVKEGSDFTAADLPINGITYNANDSLGLGDQIGEAFVIANATNFRRSFFRNFTPGNQYFAVAVEYDCNPPIYILDNLASTSITTTSVEDDFLQSVLEVFPNPSQESIKVSLETSRFKEATILLHSYRLLRDDLTLSIIEQDSGF
ncbi:MAG: hypothetical protein AAFU64_18175, partial [Bacteroidota bacterium]